MYFRIFVPFIFFLIFQILNFLFYDGYNLNVSDYTSILVILMYLSCLFAVLLFCSQYKFKNYRFEEKIRKNHKTDFFVLIIALLFLLRPTIVLFGIGFEYGFDYLRENYFNDPNLQKMAYGNSLMVAITNYYVNPFLWFYLIFISNYSDKKSKIFFYILLTLLVLFNLSYGGRFNLYYAIFILYMKNVLEGKSFITYFKKYSPLILTLVMVSLIILFERNQNNQKVLESVWLGLYEYHNLPTFLLAQKIDNAIVIWDGFTFKTSLYSFISPLFMILGSSGSSVPYFYFSVLLSDFTLYSFYTSNFYNAYATLFLYYYADNGIFAPIVIFIHIYFLLHYSRLIKDVDVRFKYLCFLAFSLYNSLFMAPFFNPGYVAIIALFPILYYFIKSYKSRG